MHLAFRTNRPCTLVLFTGAYNPILIKRSGKRVLLPGVIVISTAQFQLLNFKVSLVFNNKLIGRGGIRDRSLIMVGRAGRRK